MRYLILIIFVCLGCSNPCKTDIAAFSAKLDAIHADVLLVGIDKQMPTECNNPACKCEKCQCEDCQCNLTPEPVPMKTAAGVPLDVFLGGNTSVVKYEGTASIDERLIRCGLSVQEIAALTEDEKQKAYSAYWSKQPATKKWECKNGRCYLR
jgi:hypothetical protein